MNPPFGLLKKRQQKYEHLGKRAPIMAKEVQEVINDRLSFLTRQEVQLEREIGAINSSLERQYRNMSYKNGLLFMDGVDYRLASVIREVQESRAEINYWGFSLNKDKTEEQHHQKVKLPKVVKMANKSVNQSIKSEGREERFKFHRYEELPPQLANKWDYFTKGSTPNYYKRESLKTQPTKPLLQSSLSNSQSGIPSYHSSLVLSPHLANSKLLFQADRHKTVERKERSRRVLFNPSEIHGILEKETKLVSIWMPPSTSPQFFGIVSLLVRQKQDGSNLCLIKKYWWLRTGLSRRVFNCFLDWLGKEYGYTDELTLLSNKETFDCLFAPLGWTLINWIKQQKLRISYKRTLL